MADIGVQLADLLTHKKYKLDSLQRFLAQLSTIPRPIPLLTLAAIIPRLLKYLLTLTQQSHKEVQKLRYDIFFAPLKKNEGTRERNSTAPRTKPRKTNKLEVEAERLSLNDILEQMEEKNRNKMEVTAFTPAVTPVKIAEVGNTSSSMRPFEPEVMALISAEISSQVKPPSSKEKSLVFGSDQPDLLEYRKMLALTQKGIPMTSERKRTARTRVKTGRKVQIIEDKKIEATQGDQFIRQLELLTTKVKISRDKSFYNQDYFNLEINRIHPTLLDPDACLEKLKKYKKTALSLADGVSQNEMMEHSMFLSPLGHPREQPFFVNEENSASLSEQLQEVIREKVGEELFLRDSVSLNSFSKKYNAEGQIKGELFYQLLHSSFKLEQERQAEFGDISIRRGSPE